MEQDKTTTERRKEVSSNEEPDLANYTTFWAAPHDWKPKEQHSGPGSPGEKLRKIGLKTYYPTLRSSAMTLFEQCKRKYLYRYRLGLRPRAYMSALHTGDIYHQIMCELYSGRDMGQALGITSATVVKRREQLEKSADELGMLPNGKTIEKVLTALMSDTQLAKVLAIWVWKHYPMDLTKWVQVLPPETLIECKYETLNQLIRIRLDALIRKVDSDEVWIVDHKTTSMQSPTVRAKSVLMEIQPKLYRIAVDSYLKGYNKEHGTKLKCVGIIHNFIKKPGIRFCPDTTDRLRTTFSPAIAKKLGKNPNNLVAFHDSLTEKQREVYGSEAALILADEQFMCPWEKYLTRVEQWFSNEAKMNPEDPPYLRSRVRFVEPVMTTEILVQLRQADRAARTWPDFSKFYRDPSGTACYKFNSQCPYWDMCTNPISTWPRLIHCGFDIKTRDEEDEDKHE